MQTAHSELPALRLNKATIRRHSAVGSKGERSQGEAFDSEFTTCSTFTCIGATGWCQCCSECPYC